MSSNSSAMELGFTFPQPTPTDPLSGSAPFFGFPTASSHPHSFASPAVTSLQHSLSSLSLTPTSPASRDAYDLNERPFKRMQLASDSQQHASAQLSLSDDELKMLTALSSKLSSKLRLSRSTTTTTAAASSSSSPSPRSSSSSVSPPQLQLQQGPQPMELATTPGRPSLKRKLVPSSSFFSSATPSPPLYAALSKKQLYRSRQGFTLAPRASRSLPAPAPTYFF
eukprot:TRINITY_DN5186_c0_g2_i1.p1 TRINITY_DN5186_c0_g2~~TRINITY_DN5186_c0_g2_i1.p1  ORF type:complete len:231 (+),score=74.06 TRINITY_DN5186_c0_g2_i1:24-695(+)